MKKFKVVFLLILFLAIIGAGFYFGWMQIRLGENDYGVIFTKLKGYEPEVLNPGKFNWRWGGLLPTNLKLHVIHLEPQQTLISLKGELPSADLYSQFLEAKPPFSYDFSFRISYRLLPESLPKLLESGNLVPGNLDSWYKQFEDSCAVQAVSYLQTKAEDSGFYGTSGMDLASMESGLRENLSGNFTDIEIINVIPVSIKAPDLRLYQRARDEYMKMIDTRRGLNEAAMKEAAVRTMNQTANIQLLEEYGQLLTKYPVLLEYLGKNPRLSEDLLKSVREAP